MDYVETLYASKGKTLRTKGLPITIKDQTYEFRVDQISGEELTFFVPGNYVGRDSVGDPYYPEQGMLMEQYGAQGVYYGYWAFKTRAELSAFINALKPYIISIS